VQTKERAAMEARIESLSRLARRNEEDASAMRSERNRLVSWVRNLIYTNIHIYVYVYTCIYVYIYVCIYIEREARGGCFGDEE